MTEKESFNSRPAETEPDVSYLESIKNRLWRTSIWAGATALVAAGAAIIAPSSQADRQSVKEVPHLQYYGFDDNRLLSLSRKTSKLVAKQLKAAGATSATGYITIVEGSEDSSVDLTRICNADVAATEEGIKFNLNIAGRYADGSLGYIPRTHDQLRDFTKELFVIQDNIADCSPSNKSRTYILGNEWNKKTFNSKAPFGEGKMFRYVYPKLKADAERLKIDLSLMAGSISTTPLNNPVYSVHALKKELKGSTIDGIAVNYYLQGNDGTDELVDSALSDDSFVQTVDAIKQDFGDNITIIAGEVGAINTEAETQYTVNYTSLVAPKLPDLTSDQQGNYYQRFFTETAPCLGLKEASVEFFQDDGTGLRTGVTYFAGPKGYNNGSMGDKKPSYKYVKDAFSIMAAGGNATCTDESMSTITATGISFTNESPKYTKDKTKPIKSK